MADRKTPRFVGKTRFLVLVEFLKKCLFKCFQILCTLGTHANYLMSVIILFTFRISLFF